MVPKKLKSNKSDVKSICSSVLSQKSFEQSNDNFSMPWDLDFDNDWNFED
jgi:hypothetical protein